jgi:3-deoxy-D-manno-octulosonic-acid transferase
LGEYEQGLPVIDRIKLIYPDHKILLTFFSPSGYEVRKNNTVADVTVYLPLDTKANVSRFLKIVNPELVFFIKYEYWPNYLHALKQKRIPTYLISGIFRENQVFFKSYGGFYRRALEAFEHFFVQNVKSKELLLSLGKSNVTISGDTRFDRVASILGKDNTLDFISDFKGEKLAIVVGSSWPKDEALLVNYINSSSHDVKFIIAPHNIKDDQILLLKERLTKKTVLYTEMAGKDLADFDVFIIDTIGILTKIYSYADIAYVGGGFGNPGVHNLLEPATFGVPIVIGPNYSHFAEATALVNSTGCISISDQNGLNDAIDSLIQNGDVRNEKGHLCATFVQMNKNATNIVLKHFGHNEDK